VPAPPSASVSDAGEPAGVATRARMSWAQSLRRVFDIDVSRCSRCGEALRVLAAN